MSARDTRAGGAYVEVYAKTSKAERAMKRMANRMRAFGNQVKSIGRNMVMGGTLAIAGLVPVISTLASFQDKVSAVKAVTGATADEMATLATKAKELGAATSFSASQVAEAMVELGRAGFNPQEIDLAIESMLSLSRATDTDLAEATAIAGASLRQFNLEASEMGRVTDVLTATANGSSQTLTDLGEALKPVAPIAAEAGESIEQVSASIAILADNGIKGSLAGSALARAYKNLSSNKVAETLKSIGVESVDANGNLKTMSVILAEVGKATAGMGSAQKLNIFETLFGRGQAAALKLARAGTVFDNILEKIEKSGGIAKKTAEEMDNNIGGKLRKLMSALEGSMIRLGEAVQPVLEPLIKDVTEFLGVSSEWISQNEFLVQDLVKLTASATAFGAAIFVAGTAISLGGTLINGLTAAMAGLKAMTITTTRLMVGFGLALGALGVVGVVFVVSQLTHELSGLNDELERSQRASNKLAQKTSREQNKKLEKADSIEDPAKRVEFLEKELSRAEKVKEGLAFREKNANKRVYDTSGLIQYFANQGAGNKAAKQERKVAQQQSDQAEAFAYLMKDKIKKLKASQAKSKKKINSGTVTDSSGSDIPAFDDEKFNQESFVDQVLGDIETPAEKFSQFVENLSAALERGDITNQQYDRAFELKKSQLLTPQKSEKQQNLESFANQVKDQAKTPLDEFKERMQQVNEAVKQGLVDKKTANKFRDEESKLLVKSLGLDERKNDTAIRANKAVELGSSEGLNAIISAAFKPKSADEKQVKHLAALLVKMSTGNASLNKIVTHLQNSQVIKETNWNGGKA